MLNKFIAYRLLLRAAGILLLVWALYLVVQISIEPYYVGNAYAGPSIQYQFSETIWLILYEGAGFLLTAVKRAKVGGTSSRRREV